MAIHPILVWLKFGSYGLFSSFIIAQNVSLSVSEKAFYYEGDIPPFLSTQNQWTLNSLLHGDCYVTAEVCGLKKGGISPQDFPHFYKSKWKTSLPQNFLDTTQVNSFVLMVFQVHSNHTNVVNPDCVHSFLSMKLTLGVFSLCDVSSCAVCFWTFPFFKKVP